MTSRLSLYNGALRMLGERRLLSLTEDSAARREFDECFDDVVQGCLEEGFWHFATVSVQLDAASDIAPQFGYTMVFVKPGDWVRTYMAAANERFNTPLDDYIDEQDYWYTDTTPIYVRYVSNSPDIGLNFSRWPRTFADYVEATLALRICLTTSNSSTAADALEKKTHKLKLNARSKDAMNEPPGHPPQGTWSASRSGGWQNRSRWNRRFV